MQLKLELNTGLCLLQDSGRWGYRRLGVSSSGPMDRSSYRWANWLLGNPENAAVLEITLGKTQFKVTQPGWLVITGADLSASLNGNPLTLWQAFEVKAGDLLLFSKPRNGLRAYLATAGGWSAQNRLGSVATSMREKLGGLNGVGGAVEIGDCLTSNFSEPELTRVMPAWLIPDFNAASSFAVIPGFQYESFALHEREKLFNQSFELSKDCDRMGYRLMGVAIHSSNASLISEPVVRGAIQLPPDGQPIVLMADCQTLGGYPKLGTVFSLDLDRLSQRMPGQSLSFRKIAMAEVQKRYEAFESKF